MARLLVIDDEEGVRKLLYAVFVRKGHEVFGAESGGKASRCSSGCVRILPSWTCNFLIWAV